MLIHLYGVFHAVACCGVVLDLQVFLIFFLLQPNKMDCVFILSILYSPVQQQYKVQIGNDQPHRSEVMHKQLKSKQKLKIFSRLFSAEPLCCFPSYRCFCFSGHSMTQCVTQFSKNKFKRLLDSTLSEM